MNWIALAGALHFLRPWWLLALALLPVLAWAWRRRERARSAWHDAVDPHLLAHLLESAGRQRGRAGFVVGVLAYALAVLALAGPSWRQSAQPLWQTRTPLVVALDLSSATLAGDLPPSRLAQARAKLATLLRQRAGGQVALVAFAADAFTVAPLTDDAANVALFLDALQPDVMPRDGQRPAEAIAWSAQLLQRTGAHAGDIVLFTDHADAAALDAAGEAARQGYRVSVIGLGTDAGAAYRRGDGGIASARLDAGSLRRLAARGNGRYAALGEGDGDLRALGLLTPDGAAATGTEQAGLAWRDEGYWLLPPLMLLALFAFRRRAGALAIVLLVGVLPWRPVQAVELWRRADQAAHARVQRGNEAYRRGEFKAAADTYAGVDSATAHYNRGNALAKEGRYPQAIAAYDRALRTQPGMADAIANRRAVEAAMKRKRPPGGSQQQGQQGKSQGQGSGGAQQPQGGQSGDARNPAQQPANTARTQQPLPPSSPPKPVDAQTQQEADRAQRERMQQALQRARAGGGPQSPQQQARGQETPEQRERRLANEAWLRRLPDDPGGLLRAKFRIEFERRMQQGRIEQ